MEVGYNLHRSRRINERKTFKKGVLFSTGPFFFPGKIINISKDGARIGSRNISNLKSGLEIFISIPYSKKQGGIKLKAIVMWANMNQFGIQFIWKKRTITTKGQGAIISPLSVTHIGQLLGCTTWFCTVYANLLSRCRLQWFPMFPQIIKRTRSELCYFVYAQLIPACHWFRTAPRRLSFGHFFIVSIIRFFVFE